MVDEPVCATYEDQRIVFRRQLEAEIEDRERAADYFGWVRAVRKLLAFYPWEEPQRIEVSPEWLGRLKAQAVVFADRIGNDVDFYDGALFFRRIPVVEKSGGR